MKNVMINKISGKVNSRKYRLLVTKLSLIVCTLAVFCCNTFMLAFADNAENAKPSGVGGSNTMNNMVNLVFWIIRIAVLLMGGAPGIIKVVQGQADENPRDRNSGLAALGITGVAFGATFLVQSLI